MSSVGAVGQEQIPNGTVVAESPVKILSPEEYYDAGLRFKYGDGIAEDSKKSAACMQVAANKRHVEAMCELGYYYKEGYGVEQDDEEALRWFSASADAGCSLAMNSVGVFFATAKGGLSKDFAQAFLWYQQAYQADPDNYHAAYNIGESYMYGEGVKENMSSAIEWFRAAAEKGSASGMYALGCCYEDGEGVEKDLDESVRWYARAAQSGNDDAEKNIQKFLTNTDHERAIRYCRLAAGQGYTKAMTKLGDHYASGKGVMRDLVVARAWFAQAMKV